MLKLEKFSNNVNSKKVIGGIDPNRMYDSSHDVSYSYKVGPNHGGTEATDNGNHPWLRED